MILSTSFLYTCDTHKGLIFELEKKFFLFKKGLFSNNVYLNCNGLILIGEMYLNIFLFNWVALNCGKVLSTAVVPSSCAFVVSQKLAKRQSPRSLSQIKRN